MLLLLQLLLLQLTGSETRQVLYHVVADGRCADEVRRPAHGTRYEVVLLLLLRRRMRARLRERCRTLGVRGASRRLHLVDIVRTDVPAQHGRRRVVALDVVAQFVLACGAVVAFGAQHWLDGVVDLLMTLHMLAARERLAADGADEVLDALVRVHVVLEARAADARVRAVFERAAELVAVVLFLVHVDGSKVDRCEATHLAEEWRFTAVPLHVVSQGTWCREGTMTLATLVE